MSNAATDSNSNPIGLAPRTNVIVSSVTLSFTGRSSRKVFLIGHFSVDTTGAAGGIVASGILVDGNEMMGTQVNNLEGATGTLLSLSGVLAVKPGKHRFDLQAFATNVTFANAHHRSLTAIDLGP
ncbi:MAG TPA: hypothetical protein VMS37_26230 [Verrucomicrobiae bacterium]|nr:hypothetical protein [Verrucomicrobiae bacterium]